MCKKGKIVAIFASGVSIFEMMRAVQGDNPKSPSGDGSQLAFLSLPGESFWKYDIRVPFRGVSYGATQTDSYRQACHGALPP
jgi:hypothetical protein